MPEVKVPLGERAYSIVVEAGVLDRVGALVAETVGPHNVLVVSSPAIASHYLRGVLASLEAVGIPASVALVPPGDRTKSLRTVARLIDAALSARLERSSALIALGGGVVGDLTGFVAAIFLRGIAYIQIPTTLLAQVDASVGGKTGVNHRAGKNLVGCFHQPRLVVIDPKVLATLPQREFRSGLAEMVKHGVILDACYFEMLSHKMPELHALNEEVLAEAIAGSCALKAGIVAQDERESGRRALLNYGHTFGHALEVLTGFRRLKHGEAVAIGMEMASALAQEVGLWRDTEARRQTDLLRAARLPVRLRPGLKLDCQQLLDAMGRDKKVTGGRMRFVLPVRLGEGTVAQDIPESAVRSVCERFLCGWE